MDRGAPLPELSDVQSVLEVGTFEDALAALEEVVDILERGQLSIDEAVAWYEVGLSLSQRCSSLLDQAELKISALDDLFRLPSAGDDASAGNDG